jgi:type II secretory pathway component PulC
MKHTIIAILSLFFVIPAVTLAADLDGYSFKKISATDQKAVVKSPQGELTLVGVGDSIGATATIIEIVDDRVVLERPGKYAMEKLIVRVENGRQKIDVMKREPLSRTRQVLPQQTNQ